MKNLTRPNHYELFNVQPVVENIPKQSNNFVEESKNNSNGLLVLLSLTTFFWGIAYTVNTIKEQNKLLENRIKQRLISALKEHENEIKQA